MLDLLVELFNKHKFDNVSVVTAKLASLLTMYKAITVCLVYTVQFTSVNVYCTVYSVQCTKC